MSILSLSFIVFVIVALIVYYLVPKRFQWQVLLVASIVFYFLAATPYTIIYVIASVLTVYFATILIDKITVKEELEDSKEEKKKLQRTKKIVFITGIFVCVGMLAALKYMNFFLENTEIILGLFAKGSDLPTVNWIASLGISFYTLQMIGYLPDVYWGISKAQKNIAKLALFNCYFPQMISGPISRYHNLESELFSVHKFDIHRLYRGCLRILMGFFKKLVVSEHLINITDAVYGNPMEFGGIFVWFGTALFVVQLYSDFSGCMDIIMGVSECFGVNLTENFRTPFTSVTIQEFWQRWHITLGTWLKEYIMFPILRSNLWNKYGKFVKNKWGKRASKLLPTFTGMFVLWFAMGFWHGGGWNYIGQGVWFWFVIVIGQVFEPQTKKMVKKLKIAVESKAWHNFRCVRTAFLYAIGALFFRADSLTKAFYMLREAFSPGRLIETLKSVSAVILNIDATIGTVQLLWTVLSVFVGITVMIIWGTMETKSMHFRDWLLKHNMFINGLVIYIIIFGIILFGAYGPGYSSSEFIYGGF